MIRCLTFAGYLLLAAFAATASAQWSFGDARVSHRAHDLPPAGALPAGLTPVTLDGRRGALYAGPREVARWEITADRVAAARVSDDARHLFVLRADGRLLRRRLPGLALEAEVRTGIRASGLVLSADGRYLLAANDEPPSLLVLRAEDLEPLHWIDGSDGAARPSAFSWLGVSARRESFLAALADSPELWELSYADDPAPVFPGLVHDYRMGEGLADTGAFPLRRIGLPVCVTAAVAGPAQENLVAVPCDASALRVINLLVGREIRRLPDTEATPASAIAPWTHQERAWAAVAAGGGIAFYDLLDGVLRARADLAAPAYALVRSPGPPRLWALSGNSENGTSLAVIDAPDSARAVADVPRADSVQFSADGAWVYVVGASGIRVLDAPARAPLTSER